MFSISPQAVVRDSIVLLGCFALTYLSCLFYLYYLFIKTKKESVVTSFAQIWKKKKSSCLIRYGFPAIFYFLGAYACKIVLCKMFFALAYAYAVYKAFTYNRE